MGWDGIWDMGDMERGVICEATKGRYIPSGVVSGRLLRCHGLSHACLVCIGR